MGYAHLPFSPSTSAAAMSALVLPFSPARIKKEVEEIVRHPAARILYTKTRSLQPQGNIRMNLPLLNLSCPPLPILRGMDTFERKKESAIQT
jgi:hypothetical protein